MNKILFKKIKIYTFVNILISELSTDIDNIILNKIKNKYECKCTKYGLIKKDSIQIINRSSGVSKNEHFNSSYYFYANCIADICNPANDSLLKCKIIALNNVGFKGIINDPDTNEKIIDIMIPKITTGIIHDIDITNLKENDEIIIKICGKRIYYKESYITIIGSVSSQNIIINEEIKDDILEDDINNEKNSDDIILDHDILINDQLLDIDDEDEKLSNKDYDEKDKELIEDDEEQEQEEEEDDIDDNVEPKDDFEEDDDDI